MHNVNNNDCRAKFGMTRLILYINHHLNQSSLRA